jgi:DNA-binding protein WhiA
MRRWQGVSFAARTKKELTLVQEQSCCRQAELEALILGSGHLRPLDGRTALDIETENVATARRIYTLLKDVLAVQPEVVVRRKMRLKKNNVYAVRIPVHGEEMLARLGLVADADDHHVRIAQPRKHKPCCKRAFLRGAFLAGGSVNDPGSSSYHLEIGVADPTTAETLLELLNGYQLHARLLRRKKGFVLYVKEGEKIVEFLSIIGAHQALLRFEDVRILKGMRNQVNRLVNCETANLNKTISAAIRQLEVIRLIDERIGLQSLPDHLREVAEMRLRYPDVNLQELSARLTHKVSKSGLNHRFRRLQEIADKLRRGEYKGQ